MTYLNIKLLARDPSGRYEFLGPFLPSALSVWFGVSDFQGRSNSFFPSPGTPMALKLLPKASTKLHTFLYEYCVALSLATHPAIIGMFGIAIESSQYYGFLYEPAMHKDLISIIKPRVSAATKAWELGQQCLASAD